MRGEECTRTCARLAPDVARSARVPERGWRRVWRGVHAYLSEAGAGRGEELDNEVDGHTQHGAEGEEEPTGGRPRRVLVRLVVLEERELSPHPHEDHLSTPVTWSV